MWNHAYKLHNYPCHCSFPPLFVTNTFNTLLCLNIYEWHMQKSQYDNLLQCDDVEVGFTTFVIPFACNGIIVQVGGNITIF